MDRGLAVQTRTSNRKPDGKALVKWFLDVRGLREMPKNLDIKVARTHLYAQWLCFLITLCDRKIQPISMIFTILNKKWLNFKKMLFIFL